MAAVVGLGVDLDLDVVAEGIERVEQASELRRDGCRLGQGFLYAPAQSVDAFSAVARSLEGRELADAPPAPAHLRLASG